jgi:NADH-quinone oxidoreductase subunit A
LKPKIIQALFYREENAKTFAATAICTALNIDNQAVQKILSNVSDTKQGASIYSPLMPDNYFARYLPFLFQILVAGGLATVMVLLSFVLGKHRFTTAKMSPYECGMEPIGDMTERFSVKFYLVAMMFILFDVEAVFLYPWAVILKELKMFGFWEMLVYIGVVLAGLIYIWKKGVIDWSKTERITKTIGISGTPDFRSADYVGVPSELPIGNKVGTLDEMERSVK